MKGSSFDMGYADGMLLHDEIHTLENEFLQMVHGYVPSDFTLHILRWYVLYRNRHLSSFVPENYRLEILGFTLGCPDTHPELGNYYNRLLNYHAAHDVSYMLIDNPLVSRAGCTSFGAWGNESTGGHLISGRNFDWEAAEVFSRERIVMMCEPDGGIPFISLAWPGMAGVVSGMNRAGISVTLNGTPSSLPQETATPVAIVAREVLQKAHNLEETLAIVRKARVFVSTLWLVGSRADGRFIVIEKTPEIARVREPQQDWIVCANHFETPELKNAVRNRAYEDEATSVTRGKRITELLEQTRGRIDAPRAAEFLRDRKLPGGVFPGNGHRGTLNALIATHAVVMDLTDGIFWASSPPHQLGKFVAFDLQDFSRELPDRTIPVDGMLASGEFDRLGQSRKCLLDGERALKAKDPATALTSAEKAETINPGFYQNASLRGRALLALGRRSEAEDALRLALSEQPAFLKEREQLETLISLSRRSK